LPTPDKWQHEVDEALFGTDEAEASPDVLEPAPLDFPPTPEAGSWRRHDDVSEDLFREDDLGAVIAPVAEQVAWRPVSSSGTPPPRAVTVDALDTALFGSAVTSAPSAPAAPEPGAPPPIELPVLDEADAPSFAHSGEATVVDQDEETIAAELADAAEPTGPGRGRRRVRVLAAFTALVVIIGATAGAVIASRSGSTRPGRNTVSDHTTATTATSAPVVTTTPVPATTAPAVTAPPAAPTAPRAPATSRRTVPPPAAPAVEPPPPAPPPPEPPPEPPPSTSPPSTSPLP
jgi:hypothetical protein